MKDEDEVRWWVSQFIHDELVIYPFFSRAAALDTYEALKVDAIFAVAWGIDTGDLVVRIASFDPAHGVEISLFD